MIVHYDGAFGKGVMLGLGFAQHTVHHLRRLASDAQCAKVHDGYLTIFVYIYWQKDQGARTDFCVEDLYD